MKKFVIAAALMVSVAGFAQQKPEKKKDANAKQTERPTADQRTKDLTKELNLDKAQQAKVKALFEEEDKNRPEPPKDGEKKKPEQGEKPQQPKEKGGKGEKGGDKAQGGRGDMDKKMKDILTADQYKKWQESHKQEQGKGDKKKPEGKRPEGKKSE
ncbi:hypothetical protein ACLI1A_00535 [Flavobacterium sp. RHBU_3]|uniref:hypothetical protein n=1 Tax=Flavobacterium sp. RHBU_3 TaxID=3391184 RepID=UPI003984865C